MQKTADQALCKDKSAVLPHPSIDFDTILPYILMHLQPLMLMTCAIIVGIASYMVDQEYISHKIEIKRI